MSRLIAVKDSIDRNLLALILVLLSLGLVMLTSASISVADQTTGQPFYYLLQQLVAVAIGLSLGVVVLCTPTDLWYRMSAILVFLAIVALALVLVPGIGREVKGATRWISVAGINVQVSEPARLAMLMYISGYAVRHRDSIVSSFSGFLRPMVLVAIICGLLLAEPDFGATVVMLLISMSVLFLAGAQLKHFLVLCAAVGALLVVAIMSAPYRVQRFLGYQNPWDDPFGSGFQLTQSLIAIGSGKWFGVGLGNSVQKLFYLPEAHTDFVFAVIAEELGLAGTIGLIALFGWLVWRGLQIASKAASLERYYQAYLAFGIAVWHGAQVFINLGVNMGILPTKGLTLPLISYGRSSLIVTLIALALLLRIDIENRDPSLQAKSRKKKRSVRRSSR
jgi:cell division protein FtsW